MSKELWFHSQHGQNISTSSAAHSIFHSTGTGTPSKPNAMLCPYFFIIFICSMKQINKRPVCVSFMLVSSLSKAHVVAMLQMACDRDRSQPLHQITFYGWMCHTAVVTVQASMSIYNMQYEHHLCRCMCCQILCPCSMSIFHADHMLSSIHFSLHLVPQKTI
jgi:hypothetical protein